MNTCCVGAVGASVYREFDDPEQLARYPILDELIDPQHLYNPIPLESYKTELRFSRTYSRR